MLRMKCAAKSVRVFLLQRVFGWMVSPWELSGVMCGVQIAKCRVRSAKQV